jgi:S-ribosylhomocysteine lyase LuxS involved in autoinducer biosynthesis
LAQNFQDESGHEFNTKQVKWQKLVMQQPTLKSWTHFDSKVEENNSNLNCHLNMEFSPMHMQTTYALILHKPTEEGRVVGASTSASN